MPPEIVKVTVAVFIGSLNVTIIVFVTGTSNAASAGSVVTIYGLMQIVVKDHGFGTGPGARSRPSFTSFPPVICAVYWVQSRNRVVGTSSSVLLLFDQEGVAVIPPLIVQVTVAVFIASLKFTQIGAVIGTFVCPLAGFVFVMNGAVGGQRQG